jgi:hypothetical protein
MELKAQLRKDVNVMSYELIGLSVDAKLWKGGENDASKCYNICLAWKTVSDQ